MESLVSREATFLLNNLLFRRAGVRHPVGVMLPVATDALRGEKLNVQAGFYEFFTAAFGLPLLALMGIAPLIAWRRASLRSLRRTFLVPLAVAVSIGLVGLLLGLGSSPAGLTAFALCGFVVVGIRHRGRPRVGRAARPRRTELASGGPTAHRP